MPKIKSLYEVIKDYLKKIGADGLCNPDADCGCDINDLAPCECIDLQNCVPAKKRICANCPERNNCELVKEHSFITCCYVPMENKNNKK